MIIDFLRSCRQMLYVSEHFQIFGFGIDSLLHFLVSFILAFVLRRWLSARRTSLFLVGLIATKELIDIFAKSRVEYIQSPGLDSATDAIAGIAGLCLGLAFARRLSLKWALKGK